jgi:hypothetical protein
MLLGTALVLALTWRAGGQSVAPPPAAGTTTLATVQAAQAEVRCGPSDDPKMYVTNQLHRGDAVEVVNRQRSDGWVEIKPPRGSFSWVNRRFLQPNRDGTTWTVVCDPDARPVPVLVGSPFKAGKPDKIAVGLQRGTQVIGIGQLHADEDGEWLPIAPPEAERRYVRQEAFDPAENLPAVASAAAPLNRTALASPAAANPRAGGAGDFQAQATPSARPPGMESSPPPSPSAPAPANDLELLRQQAQRLEAAKDYAGASNLYFQLAQGYTNLDHNLAVEYYNRAVRLRGGQTSVVGASPPPADDRLRPVAAGSAGAPAASWVVGAQAPGYLQCGPYGQGTAYSVQRSGPGHLTRAACLIDGRRAYLLQTAAGEVRMYVTAAAGVNLDLEPYVGRNVELLGQIVPSNVRPQYMVVSRVIPLADFSPGPR